ncbi:SusC/RagA family TonB-linked outer membrane protein [uncultured Bacteroides sp.]|uniref:SusC/RagA family TonB-linked outer membrane protein n=1 Tax=uncultured Bacteroides sp. TaxID=162156 RepID=UPI002AAAE155|nr:SusC/RagA family TonB-linked outer membrane protein [uncultured Bacteroides sp.]
MKKRLFLLLACLWVGVGLVTAQTSRKITGIVLSDENQEPIIGATVLIEGTSIGTITDINGNFTITNAPTSAKKLQISYIGMQKQQVLIKTGLIKVLMKPDAELLQEVVVTGMQKMDKRLFTGAADKLLASDVKLDGLPEISRALEGRSAGVSVQNVSGTFGTAPKIRVRGATSIYGSSKPLWVVDGVIMEDVTEVSADDLSSGNAETLISSAVAGLNADDIESFQILKDGSATSIYGARAMAGVVVVTTKKGKAGTSRINYTSEFTMRMKPSYSNFNIMNSQEQMGIYKEMEAAGYLTLAGTYRADNSGVYGKMYHLINDYNPITGGYALANTEEAKNAYLREAEYRNTDWFDELFNNSVSINHAMSMSTGTDKASYYTSMSFMDDPGWSNQSGVQRYTANINALYHIYKNLDLNLISNASYRKQKAPGTLGSNVDVVSGEVKRDFDINPYSYALNTSRALDPNAFYVRNYAPFNIINELNNNYMKLNVLDTKFQGELKYRPFSKMEISALGAYKYSTTTQSHYIKDYSNQAWAYRAMDDATMRDANPWLYTDPDVANSLPVSVLPVGGFYKETKYAMNSWDFRGTFSYNDVYNEDHILNLFGGMEVNATDRTKTWFNGVGMQYDMGMLPAYDYLFFKQGSEENSQYYSVDETHSRSIAFFGTATYSYQGRYTVNGTLRYEGTNKLGKSRSARWLPTWNLSGAWNAHQEKFWEAIRPTVSNFTLKLSYSLTADRGPSDVTNSMAIIKSYNPWRPFTNVKESGLEISDLENSELTYEKKHELNIGAELGFINNRINLALDWYKRNNYDLIGQINTPGVGGQITKFANVASMKSHGIEVTLSTKNIKTKDFNWSTNFIFSHAKNEVTDLQSNAQIIDLITGTGFAMEGYPVRSLFSMDFRGLNEKGLPTFINENGEVTISDINFQERDKKDYLVYEGPTDPTIIGSFGNIFRYKGFRLNAFLTYSFGNVVRLDPVFKNEYDDLNAMPKEFKNRWTLPGDELKTNIPVIADKRMNQQDSKLKYAYNAYNYSTARIAKGDFIRMKEISLSYDLPKEWIKPWNFNSLSLKLQATNLFLVYSDKKLNGQDPEFFNTGGVAAPVPKQFTLTLRIGL